MLRRGSQRVLPILAMLSLPIAAQTPVTPAAAPAAPPRISEGEGSRQFGLYCRTCHTNPPVDRAPEPATLKRMAPEKIYEALTTGPMKEQAKELSDKDKRAIAEWVSARRMGASESGDAKSMPNRCASPAPVHDTSKAPAWNGWGADNANTRFQSAKAAGLTTGQVSRLKLKWAFGVPGATSMYQQPAIVDGKLFFSSDSGMVYSLDAESGCVNWSFQAQAGIRSAMSVGPAKTGSTRMAVFFGDTRGNVYSVDASKGELLWKVIADPHPVARITAAPKLFEGRLYVPVAALEEVEGGGANYPCCTSRGAMVALNAETGKQIWKTYVIQEEPKLRKKTPTSKEFWGPSGGSVWNSPTIDTKRRALYFGTGNGFTLPAVKTTDAVMALDMDTGKILWSEQGPKNDVWHGGCLASRSERGIPNPGGPTVAKDECPDEAHPDFDYSVSPIIAKLPDGRDVLISGQKSGVVHAHDLDRKGAIIWQNEVARRMMGGGGEIVFGGAVDSQSAYFPLHSGGVVAVGLADGVEKWFTPMEPPAGSEVMNKHPGQTAAVTVIPGVVFSAGLDGVLRALSATTGRVFWEFNTAQDFTTVNGVKARGGSIGSAGPVIVDGMMYVTSGYIGFQNGVPGNVLLAFGLTD